MVRGLIKRMLPRAVKDWLLAAYARCQRGALWLFSRHGRLASLYYLLFSRRFDRQHQAVLTGRLRYLQGGGMQQDSHTLLRRNIHRIEKGLIMQPRKAVFAADYIAETVAAFAEAQANHGHDEDELKWATDVLGRYFEAIDPSSQAAQFKPVYLAAISDAPSAPLEQSSVPYRFADKRVAKIAPEQFMDLCVQRRSVRWYQQKPVPREMLERAVSMATFAPSACNRQPYRFTIADDLAMARKLVAFAPGTKGFADNVPCTIVISADLANYPGERDRNLVYIDASLAAMQLMLALETLGLSSCPINWPDLEHTERKMADFLNLEVNVRPIMLMAVGYACDEGQIPFSQKKSPGQLIDYLGPGNSGPDNRGGS